MTKISELTAITSLSDLDVLPVVDSTGTQKITVENARNYFLDGVNDNVGDAYSVLNTYALGDYCIYNNTLYKCTTAITVAEAWTVGHWTVVNLGDEIGVINDKLTWKLVGTITAANPLSVNLGIYSDVEFQTYNSSLPGIIFTQRIHPIGLSATPFVVYDDYYATPSNNAIAYWSISNASTKLSGMLQNGGTDITANATTKIYAR